MFIFKNFLLKDQLKICSFLGIVLQMLLCLYWKGSDLLAVWVSRKNCFASFPGGFPIGYYTSRDSWESSRDLATLFKLETNFLRKHLMEIESALVLIDIIKHPDISYLFQKNNFTIKRKKINVNFLMLKYKLARLTKKIDAWISKAEVPKNGISPVNPSSSQVWCPGRWKLRLIRLKVKVFLRTAPFNLKLFLDTSLSKWSLVSCVFFLSEQNFFMG